MSVPRLDGSTELIIVQRMLRDLEEYLKSDVVYWHVAEPNPLGSHMPQLTIGALLEALTRAAAAQDELTPRQREELEAAPRPARSDPRGPSGPLRWQGHPRTAWPSRRLAGQS
jgi:hypothetical protein